MTGALTVTQYNKLVSSTIMGCSEIHNVIVVGEIVGLRLYPSGHYYFDLKDPTGIIRCTFFKTYASRLKFVPKDGMKVNVFGGASYYDAKGTLNFNVESMVEAGKGDLKAALEALAAKLLSEGLFDEERKREIPKYPRTIGVVTSAAGAVIKDIIDTTARRYPVNILLAPAMVQGDGAPQSIVHGIELLNNQDVDVIIVGRGGGSNDDLSAFNDESVVRAVASSKIPTISAVGHATDKSLTDRVADKYAETPTAAAMIATPDSHDELKNIFNLVRRMKASLVTYNSKNWSLFNKLDGRLSPKIFRTRVDTFHARFNGCTDRMIAFRNQIRDKHYQNQINFEHLSESMDKGIVNLLDRKRHRLELQTKSLSGLDPKGVLGRGYSFVTDAEGKVLTSTSSIAEGSEITITMRDGFVDANVKGVRRK